MKLVDLDTQRNIHERINSLNIMIADGNDAEAVLRYASKFREEIQAELLQSLLIPSTNVSEAVIYYRIADRFCKKLEEAVTLAKRKETALAKIKKQ